MTRPFKNIDVAAPNITQSRMAAINSTRDNMVATYINIAMLGGIGWQGPTYTFDSQQRAASGITTNSDSQVQVRADYTYYDSEPGTPPPLPLYEGRIKTVTVSYSEDAGATWAIVATRNHIYTPTGDMLPPVWTHA